MSRAIQNGMLPLEMIEKLKQIEKLSEHLRSLDASQE
jgi:hypothetical protein